MYRQIDRQKANKGKLRPIHFFIKKKMNHFPSGVRFEPYTAAEKKVEKSFVFFHKGKLMLVPVCVNKKKEKKERETRLRNQTTAD
jgi:hypothetical protein